MDNSNRVRKVAVVGAGGQLGRYITEALVQTQQHTVTAITRENSTTVIPSGVSSRMADYAKHESLVEALRGQDALVITLNAAAAAQGMQEKLIAAAAQAGVRWILPNEWSPDSGNERIVEDMPPFGKNVAVRRLIEGTGTSSYVAMVTGFWYEFCLANPANYGFDFAKRSVTFFDQGQTKISTSTWPQIGRAVAALLSLPIEPEESSSEKYLSRFKNQIVYIDSFNVTQEEILESALRTTGTARSDWTVRYEGARERFATGQSEVKAGNMSGFAKFCARIFFDDGCGDFRKHKGTLNALLDLPLEDLDQATAGAIERQRTTKPH